MILLPSRHVLCTPYNHAPCHFMQSHIRKVYACIAVTCHLHFWQNDRYLLRATEVTRGWNGYRNKSQHRKLTLEKERKKEKFRNSCGDSNPRLLNLEPGALTTELSPRPRCLALHVLDYTTTGVSGRFHIVSLFRERCLSLEVCCLQDWTWEARATQADPAELALSVMRSRGSSLAVSIMYNCDNATRLKTEFKNKVL